MDYKKIYDQLIEKRLREPARGYTESHHIIPKSLGGSNDSSNLVNLTLREHFIAHRLLTKFTTGRDKIKMMDAIWGMINRTGMTLNSYCYESVRSDFMKTVSERVKQQWRDGNASLPPVHTGKFWWMHPDYDKGIRSEKCPGPGWIRGKKPKNFNQQASVYVNGQKFEWSKDAAEFIGCARSVITSWKDRGAPYKGVFLITSVPLDV